MKKGPTARVYTSKWCEKSDFRKKRIRNDNVRLLRTREGREQRCIPCMYVWACESNVGDIEYVRAAFFSTLNRSESWSDCFHSIDFLFVICSHHFSTTNWNIWFMIGKKIYLHLFVKIRQWPKVKESRRIEIHWETENLAALHLDRWLLSLGIFFRYSDFLWFNVCIFFYIELDNSYALI